jgi:hypothetical protein
LDVGDCHGVWGATTPRERRAMLVAWRSDVHSLYDDERLAEFSLLPMLEQAGVGSH